jgi:hypothetical protein
VSKHYREAVAKDAAERAYDNIKHTAPLAVPQMLFGPILWALTDANVQPTPSADRELAAFMAGYVAGGDDECTAWNNAGPGRGADAAYAAWLASQPQEPKPSAPFYQAPAEDVR